MFPFSSYVSGDKAYRPEEPVNEHSHPSPEYSLPSTTLNPIRNTHMEEIDVPMVNLTSAAALRVFGREKDRGHMVTTQAE